MPDNHEEVLIVIVAGTIIFLVLTGIMTFISIYYQKKKFQHHQQLIDREKEYNEQLLQSQLEMQEQTFNTISREIHDNVGQVLSLAKVQLNIIDQTEQIDKSMLGDVKESISKAMTDLRDIARSLNTERIQLISLPETVGNELKRINRAGFTYAALHVEGSEQNMQDQKKLIIFRIIQESLQNIIKHSKASNVNVFFCYDELHLKIEIADNGTGFDTAIFNDKAAGLGLQNIISRAALIGGEATINSVINEGTTITIKTPYA
jgi:two-component system, NarL family, sensor kinase